MALSVEEIGKLRESGFSDDDIVSYNNQLAAQTAAPVAPNAAPAELPKYSETDIPTTTAPPEGTITEDVMSTAPIVQQAIPYAAGAAATGAGGYIAKKAIETVATNAARNAMAAPPAAPVAPEPVPKIQVPQSVGSGPRPVGPVAPVAGAPATPVVRESIGMRNMPMPEPNAINGGNTYLQRMAVLAESVAPTLGRIGGATTALIMPGNIGQQINEEEEIRKRRAKAKVK